MSGAGATKAPIIFTGIRRQVVGPANFPAAPLKRVPLLGSLLTPDPLAPPKPNAPPSWGMQPPAPPSHWISELTDGIGKCLSFGCDEPQNAFAARTIDHIVKDWRNLLVGSHGYIAGERKSLESQQVGSGDLDRNGQVSHAAYMRLIEGSRATFIRGFGLEDPKNRKAWENMMLQNDIGFSLESIKIEFNFPVTFPDTVSMYHKVSLCPERIHTALKLESVVLSHKHRRVAARSVEVLGTYDYKNATVVELPPFVRYGMRKYWEKQWRQITWADWRIARLREDVKDLAKATWNHENAVEDFGTAPRPIKESPVANTGTAATTNESPVADITAATEASEESQIANTATEAEASEESPIANTATEAEASEESPIANTATEAEASEESQIASTATEAEASEENPPANTVESGVVGEAVGEEETKVN